MQNILKATKIKLTTSSNFFTFNLFPSTKIAVKNKNTKKILTFTIVEAFGFDGEFVRAANFISSGQIIISDNFASFNFSSARFVRNIQGNFVRKLINCDSNLKGQFCVLECLSSQLFSIINILSLWLSFID